MEPNLENGSGAVEICFVFTRGTIKVDQAARNGHDVDTIWVTRREPRGRIAHHVDVAHHLIHEITRLLHGVHLGAFGEIPLLHLDHAFHHHCEHNDHDGDGDQHLQQGEAGCAVDILRASFHGSDHE